MSKAISEPVQFNGNWFFPGFRQNILQYYCSQIGNIRAVISPLNNTVTVSNSLHKFYLKNNFCDFTLSQVRDSISDLSSQVGYNLEDAKIKKIEYGCNIATGKLNQYLNSIDSLDNKPFYPMVGKGKKYGMRCERDQYLVKAYDKTRQVKIADKISISPGLLRCEIKVTDMRYLNKRKEKIPIHCLADLTDQKKVQCLADDLNEKFTRVRSRGGVDFSALSLNEKRIFACYLCKEIWEDVRFHHIHSFRNDKRILREIFRNGYCDLADSITKELQDKTRHLLAN